MARATSDPRVLSLVNFAARDLDVPTSPSPRAWERLRDELRQFCSGTGGWEDPSSTLIGIGPPEPPTNDEIRAIHADVRRQLVNVVADAVDLHVARLAGRHMPVDVPVTLTAGVHPAGGGRSFLMVTGGSWKDAAGAANGTVKSRARLGVLGRMLGLAFERNKLARPLRIHKLKEAAPRSGFFELDQYLAVRARLPEDLRVSLSSA